MTHVEDRYSLFFSSLFDLFDLAVKILQLSGKTKKEKRHSP
jgi:hypothetical protein